MQEWDICNAELLCAILHDFCLLFWFIMIGDFKLSKEHEMRWWMTLSIWVNDNKPAMHCLPVWFIIAKTDFWSFKTTCCTVNRKKTIKACDLWGILNNSKSFWKFCTLLLRWKKFWKNKNPYKWPLKYQKQKTNKKKLVCYTVYIFIFK